MEHILRFLNVFTLTAELNKLLRFCLVPDNDKTLGNQRKITVEGFNIWSSFYSRRRFLKGTFQQTSREMK
jgi:hypothetical protein